jgi:hypothetical protein
VRGRLMLMSPEEMSPPLATLAPGDRDRWMTITVDVVTAVSCAARWTRPVTARAASSHPHNAGAGVFRVLRSQPWARGSSPGRFRGEQDRSRCMADESPHRARTLARRSPAAESGRPRDRCARGLHWARWRPRWQRALALSSPRTMAHRSVGRGARSSDARAVTPGARARAARRCQGDPSNDRRRQSG